MSGELYRDMGRHWPGIGLRLLLLVLAITWTLEGVKLHRGAVHFARDEFPGVVQDFPPITIKDGIVSSPVQQPYEIRDHESGKLFAVVDTTGKISSLDDTEAMILLTETKLHYRENNGNGQTKIQDLKQIKNFYIDKAVATSWVDWGARWAAAVLIPIAFIASFLYRLVQGIIYAAIGLIWNGAFNAKLSFAALMRLSFAAVTPVILLSTVLDLLNINVPLWPLICLALAMVYLGVAVKANEQTATEYGYGGGQGFPPQAFPPGTMPPGYPPQQYPPAYGNPTTPPQSPPTM